MATRSELVDMAVAAGLDEDEVEELTDEELLELGDEVDYQDQGSLDQPVQVDDPQEAAAEVGTPELRSAARLRSGVNQRREPFPWEVGPPKRR